MSPRPSVLSMGPAEAESIATDLAVLAINGADDTAILDAALVAVEGRMADGVMAVLLGSVRLAAGPWMPAPDDPE